MVEKYYNDDKTAIAVLVSKGWGAGWSTWIGDNAAAYDKRIIEKYFQNYSDNEIDKYLKEIGYDEPYVGGWSDCEIYWVPVGTKFYIYEYDGNEYLITEDKMEMA